MPDPIQVEWITVCVKHGYCRQEVLAPTELLDSARRSTGTPNDATLIGMGPSGRKGLMPELTPRVASTKPGDDAVFHYFSRASELLDQVAADRAFVATLVAIADRIAGALRAGGKLLVAGNGGSAAAAQHISAEFLSRFTRDRRPLPSVALTADSSALTAIGNDYGFDRVFERQVRGLGRPGDVFLGISTSGRSPNVLVALEAARAIGVTTIGLTGSDGAAMRASCELLLVVPCTETALTQQVQLAAGHAICELVECALFDAQAR